MRREQIQDKRATLTKKHPYADESTIPLIIYKSFDIYANFWALFIVY